MPGRELDDGVRLPFTADDVREGPARNLGGINPRGVTAACSDDRVAVHHVDDTSHLSEEGSAPCGIVVPLFLLSWRRLRPYAVNEPQRSRRMR